MVPIGVTGSAANDDNTCVVDILPIRLTGSAAYGFSTRTGNAANGANRRGR